MGCDIHAMIERRILSPRQTYAYWINAGDPNINRPYNVFAALAGVRRGIEIEPVAPPRGIPGGGVEDACSAMRAWHDSWEGDAHSASWLTLAEMKAYGMPPNLIDDGYGAWSESDTAEWRRIIAEMERVKRDGDTDDDVRLVFFFDN